jgi:tetratricopeptide (TPR) repeat protein
MGKTQIALQLAHSAMELERACSVIWLPAFSQAGFQQACYQLVQILPRQQDSEADPREVFRQYFSSSSAGKWLIIVDNVDDSRVLYGSSDAASGIYQYLPRSSTGSILMTTRSRAVAVEFASTKIVELRHMSPDDAIGLLRKSLLDQDQLDLGTDVERLLQTLSSLPLAIVQASAYMNTLDVSIAEYIHLCNNTDQDMVELMRSKIHDDTYHSESQGAVATTWLISFNQLREANPAAAKLLLFISMIEPKDIPRSILPQPGTEQELRQAIGTLRGFGFIGQIKNQETFEMHSLVHLMAQSWAKNQSSPDDIDSAINHLMTIFPSPEWENRRLWQQYLPHGLRVFWVQKDVSEFQGMLLGYRIAKYLTIDGRDQETTVIMEHVVEVLKKTFEVSHPTLLTAQHQLACAYLANGQFHHAITLLEHVMKWHEKTLAEDHPHRLLSLCALAQAYTKNKRVRDGIELLERVVKIRERVDKETHLHRLAAQHDLASAYIANGQSKEAIGILERVVKIQELVLPPDHHEQLSSKQELGQAYLTDGQVNLGLRLLADVVTLQEGVIPEEHPVRLMSKSCLARAYLISGQVDVCMKIMEEVAASLEANVAESHPERIHAQHALAETYMISGQFQKALSLQIRVVELRDNGLPEGHPHRVRAHALLQDIRRKMEP